MTNAPRLLTNDQRTQLLDKLPQLPLAAWNGGRTALLDNLPLELTSRIDRSPVPTIDLANIVRAIENGGNRLVLAEFLHTAERQARGSAIEAIFTSLYAEISNKAPEDMEVHTELEDSDPATVSLIAALADQEPVGAVAQALRLRGMRVFQDPLTTAAALPATQQYDLIVLYVSRHTLEDPTLWSHLLDMVSARRQDEADVPVIPVLEDLLWEDLPADRTRLAARSPIMWTADSEAFGASNSGARRVLMAALARRLHKRRDTKPTGPITIRLSSFPHQFPLETLHLDLDWRAAFGFPDPKLRLPGTVLPPEQWACELLPALDDVAYALAELGRPTGVDVWAKVRLPVAVAFGHYFPHSGTVPLRWRQDDGTVWTCRDRPQADADLALGPVAPITTDHLQEPTLLLELPIARAIGADVDRWLEHANPVPRFRLRGAHATKDPGRVIDSPQQGRNWAGLIGDRVRNLWTERQIDGVHLFLSSTVEFAGLLGQELQDHYTRPHPIHLYVEDEDQGYRRVCTLP